MKKDDYKLILITLSVSALAFLCPGLSFASMDTSPLDMMQTGSPYSSAQFSKIANSGAYNQPPTAKSLVPDMEGPQLAGSTIVWSGTAYDPDGDKLLYQFWLNGPSTGNSWKPMTNWSDSSSWNWTTSDIDGGNNIVDIRIRDGHHGAPWEWDSHISAEYTIDVSSDGGMSAESKPYLIGLQSDIQSPQDQGVKVTWTATALDKEEDTVLYRYWLKGPTTQEQWKPMTPWTTNNAWTWNTAQTRAGIYSVEVRIRDGYHEGIESSDDSERAVYVIKQSGIIE